MLKESIVAACLLASCGDAHSALTLHWEHGVIGGINEIKHGPVVLLLDTPCRLIVKPAPGFQWARALLATGSKVIEACWYEVPATTITANYVQLNLSDGHRTRVPRAWFKPEGREI
jgi:hypothetical protein